MAQLITPLPGSFLPEGLIHVVAFVVGFAIITFLHVTYGELASKSFAIANPERSSLAVAPLMKFFYYLFLPLVKVTNGLANASTRLVGIPPPSETEEQHSEDECADRILGSVHVKDVVRAARDDSGPEADITTGQLAHGVLTIPENRRVDQVLYDLQRERLQMAMVVDEWGSFEGIVTIEDILGEIVGDIYDEFDAEPAPVLRERGGGSYDVAGSAALRDVNEALGSRFESAGS